MASTLVTDTADTASTGEEHKNSSDKHLESILPSALPQVGGESMDDISDKQQKRIRRKVDWRLMPVLTLLYLFANVDRGNIGNAKIQGLEKSLNMRGSDYNVASMIFFVPYILCEIPSNVILLKFRRPSIYLGILVSCWGIVMTCSGVVQSFGGLVATRFLLGVFEAGFVPGAVFLISQWYPPHLTQVRLAIFFAATAISGALSGLLAAAITTMDGLGGYEAWRWIFVIEGLITFVLGLSCFFVLPDSPSLSGSWLSEREVQFLNRLHEKHRAARKQPKPEYEKRHRVQRAVLLSVFADWQIYLQSLIFISSLMPAYALKFAMPQIILNSRQFLVIFSHFVITNVCFPSLISLLISNLSNNSIIFHLISDQILSAIWQLTLGTAVGFTNIQAQLLTAPPYVCGAISAVISSILADKLTWRLPFIVGPQALLLVAFAVLFRLSADITANVAVCYFCVHLTCIGTFPISPGASAWLINNLATPPKRAVGVALMVAIGNVGGIIGSVIFQDRERPRYPTGWGNCLAFAAAGMVAALTLEVTYLSINKKRARRSEEEVREKYDEAVLERMGDRSPLFRYSL